MNPKDKKLISLFLIFSLMILSVNLYAKERRGAKLIITKKDGQLIEGELITVKPTSLLLLNTDGKDESVDIADIRIITIVKKSKVWKGALTGLLVAGGLSLIVAISGVGDETFFVTFYEGFATLFAGPGVLIGGIAGAVAGTDKTIQIEGMTDSEIQETLDKLRKKARVRNYK
jgi:hypothetical protein